MNCGELKSFGNISHANGFHRFVAGHTFSLLILFYYLFALSGMALCSHYHCSFLAHKCFISIPQNSFQQKPSEIVFIFIYPPVSVPPSKYISLRHFSLYPIANKDINNNNTNEKRANHIFRIECVFIFRIKILTFCDHNESHKDHLFLAVAWNT